MNPTLDSEDQALLQKLAAERESLAATIDAAAQKRGDIVRQLAELEDPYRPFKKAHSEGPDRVQYFNGTSWIDVSRSFAAWDAYSIEKFRLTPPDPYAAFRAAQRAGKIIQCNSPASEGWCDLAPQSMLWRLPVENYRIKPEDPYADLKAAHAAGKTIQLHVECQGWSDCPHPLWSQPISNYRIKPEPRPLEQSDFGPVTWLRWPSDRVALCSVIKIEATRVWVGVSGVLVPFRFEDLARDEVERSSDLRNWEPCSK